MTTGEIMTLLQARGYAFNRALGQHFLADEDALDAIVNIARVDEHTNVLEIGPGAGVLTGPLARRAKRAAKFLLVGALGRWQPSFHP
jgi:16S rRNA (adenine1518-N6/adenine1519-N6)-dimethyltransferase